MTLALFCACGQTRHRLTPYSFSSSARLSPDTQPTYGRDNGLRPPGGSSCGSRAGGVIAGSGNHTQSLLRPPSVGNTLLCTRFVRPIPCVGHTAAIRAHRTGTLPRHPPAPTTSGATPGRTSRACRPAEPPGHVWSRARKEVPGQVGWERQGLSRGLGGGHADRPCHGPGEARARTTGRWPFTPSHTGSSLRHRPRGSVCWAAMSRRCGPPPARRRPGAAPQPGPWTPRTAMRRAYGPGRAEVRR